MAEYLLLVVRGAVALSSGAAGVVALTHWLVRRGAVTPFAWWPRTIRQLAEPAVRPMERQVVRRGGNPQHAPYWLLAIVVGIGLVAISFTGWLIGFAAEVRWASSGGPRGALAFIVIRTCDLLALALMVRAIGSWFGFGEYTRWMRPFYFLTDWIVVPLRKVIPPVGMVDISPVVAWLIITFGIRTFLLMLLG